MSPRPIDLDVLVGQACIEASHRMASALLLAIDNSTADERPFSQLQQVALIEAALMEHDGMRESLLDTFKTMRLLGEMADGAS